MGVVLGVFRVQVTVFVIKQAVDVQILRTLAKGQFAQRLVIPVDVGIVEYLVGLRAFGRNMAD